MRVRGMLALAAAAVAVFAAASAADGAAQGFDWSSDAGHGSFSQRVPLKQTLEVGVIPAGLYGVKVTLSSPNDADVQLTEKESGRLLVGWPNGVLRAHNHSCAETDGMKLCYSGYNGGGTVATTGRETIEVRTWTSRDLVLSVFGYAEAQANVTYSWQLSARDCTLKDGRPFTAPGEEKSRAEVGVVPAGTTELDVQLASDNDIDLQLDDGATKVVNWHGGLLRSHKKECKDYKGVHVCYSGYNGDGTAAGVGHEYVRLRGRLPSDWKISAYYYKRGEARVTYSFKKDHAACMSLPVTKPFRFVVPGADSYRRFARLAGEDNPYAADSVNRAVARLGGGFLLRHREGTPSVPANVTVEAKLTLLTTDNEAHPTYADLVLRANRSKSGAGEWTVRLSDEMPVGRYRLGVLVNGREVQGALPANATLYVVFDPRLHGMTRREDLEAYVLKDKGPIWYGSAYSHTSLQWGFNQFQQLEASMLVLERMLGTHGLQTEERWQPHRVVRELTYVLGNQVLKGRWDGRYYDGTAPSTWTDSGMILQQWRRNPRAQVRYGQCWVFSAVTTTVARALGLPARSVTNFESAHDHAPYDLVIERARGESIWNFHVWNEVFFRGGGHTGWWAADSTPQELSDGYYQCGPTPVRDVRELPLGLPGSGVPAGVRKDTAFVAGEVDAHVWLASQPYHQRASNASVHAHEYDAAKVGRAISTEKPACHGAGNACRLDLTDLYRVDGKRLARKSSRLSLLEVQARAAAGQPEQQPHFRVDVRRVDARTNRTLPGAPQLGDTVVVALRRTAAALPQAANATVRASASFRLTEYSGDVMATLLTAQGAAAACKANATCYEARLSPEVYAPHLHRGSSLLLRVDAEVSGGRTYAFERDLLLLAPPVRVTLPAGGVRRFQRFRANVTVFNPLPVPLTHLVVAADTPGPEDVETVAFAAAVVPPHGNLTVSTADLVASACGPSYTVSVSVASAQLSGLLRGESSVRVPCNSSAPRPDKDMPPLQVVEPGQGAAGPEPHDCCGAPSSCRAAHLHTCAPAQAEPHPPVPHDCCGKANVTCPMSAVHSCGAQAAAAPKAAAVTTAAAAAAPAHDRKRAPAHHQTVVVETSMVPVTYDN